MRVSYLSLVLASGFAGASAGKPPAPPCAAPPGIVPVVNESLCFQMIEPTNPSGVSIRQYGFPPNATFATGVGGGAFLQGVQGSIASVLSYFAGANDQQRDISAAKTTPFAIIPPKNAASGTWTANLQISPSQFPDAFLIPRPNPPVRLSLVADDIGLPAYIAVFQFNTTGFPYLENCQEACGVIQNSTLPAGYAINASHPFSPTFVFYNGQNSVNFTSECWMAVYATSE